MSSNFKKPSTGHYILFVLAFLTACFIVGVLVGNSMLVAERRERATATAIEATFTDPAPLIIEKKPVDERIECPSTRVDEAFLQRVLTALADPENAKRFSQWMGPKDGESHVVMIFSAGRTRYSLDYDPTGRFPSISVWENSGRKVSHANRDTYTDDGLEGCVNFGIGGPKTGSSYNFQWNMLGYFEGNLTEGHAYWQNRYATFVTALGQVLDVT